MGCLNSKEANGERINITENHIKPSESRVDIPLPFNRKRKASVWEGAAATENVAKNPKPLVVVLFGGPGSRKGAVLDEMISVFGFHYISFEDVIRQEVLLPLAKEDVIREEKDRLTELGQSEEKISEAAGNININCKVLVAEGQAISNGQGEPKKSQLNNDGSEEEVSTELNCHVGMWSLQGCLTAHNHEMKVDKLFPHLGRRMERIMNGNRNMKFVIDLIPNLNYLVGEGIEYFTDDTFCRMGLEKFEAKYPVAFALNLTIPPDKLDDLTTMSGLVSSSLRTPKKQDPKAKAKAKEKEKNRKSSIQKAQSGMADEKNSKRTMKRLRSYKRASKWFLNYFEQTGRLITINIGSGDSNVVTSGVNFTLGNFGYKKCRSANTVICFAFSDADVEDYNIGKYQLEQIDLKDIAHDPLGESGQLINSACRAIDKSADNDGFVLNLAQTTLVDDFSKMEGSTEITFLPLDLGILENFLPGYPKSNQRAAGQSVYRGVWALDNQTYVFPMELDYTSCLNMAEKFAYKRQQIWRKKMNV